MSIFNLNDVKEVISGEELNDFYKENGMFICDTTEGKQDDKFLRNFVAYKTAEYINNKLALKEANKELGL
jgi:hypothetical protein